MNQEKLMLIVKYDPDTGDFFWLNRSENTHSMFMSEESMHSVSHSTKLWNSRNAFKKIGSKSHGYLEVRISNRLYRLHSLAWLYVYGEIPNRIDHKNGIRSDNRIINLRVCTQSENCKNSAKRANNTSGFTGVYFFKRLNKWAAKIVCDGKQIHVGCFDTPELADSARKLKLKEYGFHENHGRDQHDEYKKRA